MKRISTATKAADLFGAGKHGWRDGDLSISVIPTDGEAAWFNNLQEEVANVVEANGITLDGNVRTQLYQAIQLMIAGAINNGLKTPVRFTTIGNIVLSGLGTQAGGDWGVALTAGDRILSKDQTTGSQSGIHIAAAGAWARATDADGVGELPPGALVVVQEGATLADSEWELSTDGPIIIGTTALSFVRKDVGVVTSASIQGAFKNLQSSATGLSAVVTVTADEIVLKSAANAYVTRRGFSASINTAAAGKNGLCTGVLAISTWYAVFAGFDGTSDCGWIDPSASLPTVPSGVTHYARVGWIRTDASGNKYPFGFTQRGRSVVWLIGSGNLATPMQMSSGAVGVASGASYTGVAVAWANYAPPTAAKIRIGLTSTSSALLCASANPNRSGAASVNPPELGYSYASFPAFTYGDLMIESSNIYWASSAVSGYLLSGGWEDNI
ncbi:MAG: hypothetical protein Q7K57_49475 [Burkholderiaceae bacterium]|nr:hypothetical protein [Burkholderiaceae bacterium]